MAERERSPFGMLVRAYRQQLGLTQQGLVDRLNDFPGSDGGFTLRTVQEWERQYPPDVSWRNPHAANVRSLAAALDLIAGSAEWAVLHQAARQRRDDPSQPVAADQTPHGTSTTITDQFIVAGREPHLTSLGHVIDDAMRGVPGVTFVSADPGSGKSWLTSRAVRDALQRHPNLVVLWGESALLGDPHQPFRQILSHMVGGVVHASFRQMVSMDNQRRLIERVPVGLEAVLTYPEGLLDRFVPTALLQTQADNPVLPAPLAERLAHTLDAGNPGPGAYGPNELVSRVIGAYVANQPTILVFEDLHWADTGTAAMLHQLIGTIAGSTLPVGIIGTYRPGDLPSSDAAPIAAVVREAARLFPAAELDLSSAIGGEAGQGFVNAFVEANVADPPPDLASMLFTATAGLPLFVAGMLRWYQEEGGLRASATGDMLEWHHHPRRLPGEIASMLNRLLDQLPPDLRLIMDIASVQGTIFSAEALHVLLGVTSTELMHQLDTLLDDRYRLIVAAGTSETAGQRSHDYVFVHALFRDELYQRLSPFEREHHHLATADALAERWGSAPHEGCTRIALHYRLGGDKGKTGTFAMWAGDYWLDRHHYAEARAMYDLVQELDLRMDEPLLAAQSLIGLGNCDRGVGNISAGRERFAEARAIAKREYLPLVQANALTSEAMLDFDAGRMARGAELLTEAVDVLLEFGDYHEASRSITLLSHTLHGTGRYAEAALRAQEAIDLARGLGYELLEAGGMIALGNCWLDIGLYDDAIEIYEACLEICRRHENTHRAAICWLNISLCSFELGAWDRGRQALAQVFELESVINPRLVGAAHFNAAVIDELTGNLDAAETSYGASLDIRERFDQQSLQVDAWGGLLRVALLRREYEAAEKLLGRIETYLATNGIDGVEHPGRLYVTLVKTHGALNQPGRQRAVLAGGLAMLDQRAALLTDPGHRQVYLESVPSHRMLREMGREISTKPAPAN